MIAPFRMKPYAGCCDIGSIAVLRTKLMCASPAKLLQRQVGRRQTNCQRPLQSHLNLLGQWPLLAGSDPPICAPQHDLNDRIVVEADLHISFPRHREWLLMADRSSSSTAASELSDLKIASLTERPLRRKLDGGIGHSG